MEKKVCANAETRHLKVYNLRSLTKYKHLHITNEEEDILLTATLQLQG